MAAAVSRTLGRTLPAGKKISSNLATPSSVLASRPLSTTSNLKQDPTLLQDKQNGFGFIRSNPRPDKPRQVGVTEIRGPYYSAYGKRHLQDVLETFGHHVDGLKFSGGGFSLMPEGRLRELIDIAHEHGVYVSTGGWMEHILTQSDAMSAVEKYLTKCKDLGFDVVECSAGFLSIPPDDFLRLVDKVQSMGLKAKPELGIQFGAGGDTSAEELEAAGSSDPSKVVNLAKRFINESGVERIMIESEGITENVKSWRTDVIQNILKELPAEKVMFEAADPAVFNWYIREFGVDVNLFVDHSQIVQLSCLRSGIWGMADTFGKVVSYR
ncbi:hypothetical protein PMZ80_008651 [Knufia obscura]|uniref:Sulfonate biosynthesis enzyme n=1 Tax=Knufia obscura TaxID=1635080 RepID=A0ABR0RFF2_9EURO|nr:hypothetical protein PMZ80_008651 [Knufia obscura]